MRSATLIAYLFFFVLGIQNSTAQLRKDIIAGPMLGEVSFRSAKIWAEVKPGTQTTILYWKKGEIKNIRKQSIITDSKEWFTPVVFNLVELDMNATYEYQIFTGATSDKPGKPDGTFTTKDQWAYRKPVPDFTFLTGSCAYFNDPPYDRLYANIINLDKPAIPYGGDSTIFETMAKEKADFMLWLGDNWYDREADYSSEWGLWHRASRDRRMPVLQNLLKAMPHYAIWDDHDYGPNDGDKSYVLKETSRKVFMNYWVNPSYGENSQGIYTKFNHADVDFFLMDDRSFRSADAMQPLIDGKPNPNKRMWGEQQMEWLKNALANSNATFKLIVTGSQVLNAASTFDCLQHYPYEFNELIEFLSSQKVNGVLFLTGDRHHSEVIKYTRPNTYALYDVTSSPLTSGVGRVGGKEKDNSDRVAGTLVEAQNYTRISISGNLKQRVLKVEFMGIKGDKLAEWSIQEQELK